MSILYEEIARKLDARDAGAARVGETVWRDAALALERVWERRAAGLVVRGAGEGAQHLACAMACISRRGAEVCPISLEVPESELDLLPRRGAPVAGVRDTVWPLARRDVLLDGLGLELYDPRTVAAFLAARLAGFGGVIRPGAPATFVWTPLGWNELSARYGAELAYQAQQAWVEVVVP